MHLALFSQSASHVNCFPDRQQRSVRIGGRGEKDARYVLHMPSVPILLPHADDWTDAGVVFAGALLLRQQTSGLPEHRLADADGGTQAFRNVALDRRLKWSSCYVFEIFMAILVLSDTFRPSFPFKHFLR